MFEAFPIKHWICFKQPVCLVDTLNSFSFQFHQKSPGLHWIRWSHVLALEYSRCVKYWVLLGGFFQEVERSWNRQWIESYVFLIFSIPVCLESSELQKIKFLSAGSFGFGHWVEKSISNIIEIHRMPRWDHRFRMFRSQPILVVFRMLMSLIEVISSYTAWNVSSDCHWTW